MIRASTLRGVQEALAGLYDLELGVSIDDFVCDEALARALGGEDAIRRREVLFVVDDEAGTHVGLYLSDEARDAATDPGAWRTQFESMCLVAEGVSHFVLVHFRAEHQAPIRELELELQAEVDKYALSLLGDSSLPSEPGVALEHAASMRGEGLLAGNGVGLLRERSRHLRRRLFDESELLDAPGTERAERYRAATQLAEAYTRRLERTHVERGDLGALVSELRRFYRLGLAEKLDRCRGR